MRLLEGGMIHHEKPNRDRNVILEGGVEACHARQTTERHATLVSLSRLAATT